MHSKKIIISCERELRSWLNVHQDAIGFHIESLWVYFHLWHIAIQLHISFLHVLAVFDGDGRFLQLVRGEDARGDRDFRDKKHGAARSREW